MTATALFDAMTQGEPDSVSGEIAVRLANRLVEGCLSDWQRNREYEDDAVPDLDVPPIQALNRLQSIRALHQQWVGEAEQVLLRVGRLGGGVSRVEDLEHAYGMARARLNLSPEAVMRAMDQVRRGEVVSAKELRDDLRARLRA